MTGAWRRAFSLLHFINRPGPILFQQPRHGAICKQSSTRLTPRAVIRLVVGVADPLDRCTAYGTRKLVPSMNCHAFAKGGQLLGKLLPLFLPQLGNPVLERRSRGMVQALDLLIAELSGSSQGGETSPVQDLV